MSSDYLIILNPKANNGKAIKNWPKIKNILESNKIKYKLRITRKINHAKLITNYYLEKWKKQNLFPKCIIVVGGDGTINEVLSSIITQNMDHSIPIGILPFGKNNKFIKANNSNNLKWENILLNIIKNKKSQNIKIGTFNEKIKQEHGIFTDQMIIGLDINYKKEKNTFNRLKSMITLIPLLYNTEYFNANVKVDSKKYKLKKAIICSVQNTNNKQNKPLQLVIIQKRNIFQLIFTILSILISKNYKFKSVHKFYGKNINISISSLEYGKIDGNDLGSRFYNIEYNTIKYPFII